MTNNEFKDLVKNRKDAEITLNNEIVLSLKHLDRKPKTIKLSLDLNDSFELLYIRKAVYRKIYRFCIQRCIRAYVNISSWNSQDTYLIITIHSYKDYNRCADLFQYLNGKKLVKTARNNNSYLIE